MEVSPRGYVSAIEEWRKARDHFFKSHYASPLGEVARDAFAGLSYFDVDPELVFSAELEPPAEDEIDIEASTGTTSLYRKAGEVKLPLSRGTVSLVVLRGADDDMFIPFRDKTNGDGSYEAGRYVAVDRNPDGELLIDFNKATNPYCAYDPEFSCPLPPPQNTIAFRIEAGEMAFA
jgi:uncharacterized protein (DUF1684 family)